MVEGWFEDDYFIIFDELESKEATEKYEIPSFLEGCQVVGSKGWDDFILLYGDRLVTCPTIPLNEECFESIDLGIVGQGLEQDSGLKGKIKWYVKPLIFGGSTERTNEQWVSLSEHCKLVAFWNHQYAAAKGITRGCSRP